MEVSKEGKEGNTVEVSNGDDGGNVGNAIEVSNGDDVSNEGNAIEVSNAGEVHWRLHFTVNCILLDYHYPTGPTKVNYCTK